MLLVDDLLALTDEVQGYVDQAKTYIEEHLKNDEVDVTPIDRAKLTSCEAELKTQRIELVRRRSTLRDALLRLAGLDVRGAFELADKELTLVSLPAVDPAVLLEDARLTHPELGAATAGVRALTSKRDAIRAGLWPDLFVAGRARYGVAPNRDRQKSPFAKDDFNFLDAGIAVGLRYDWLTGVTGAEIAKASAELLALEDKRQALAERVAHDLQAALDDWRAAGDKIEATKAGFKASRAWSVFARNGFELGTVSAKDLIDALAAFVKARFAFLTLTYEYNVAAARLSQTTGREILPELEAGVW
jgi:outer membrane protein TolC